MKKSALNRIIIWSVVSVLVIGILVSSLAFISYTGIMPSFDRIIYGSDYDINTENEYDQTNGLTDTGSMISYINLYLSTGKVIFEKNDSDELVVEQLVNSSDDEADYSEGFYYRYGCADNCYESNTLEIYGSYEDFQLQDQDFSSSDFTLLFESALKNIPEQTILVKIPKSLYLNEIKIYAASADIKINNVSPDYLTINSFSGNINASSIESYSMYINNISNEVNLKNVKADDISVETVSGNVNVDGEFETFTSNSVSGDLYYSTNSSSNYLTSINTVSGDAYLTLPESYGFTLDNSSISGSVVSKLKGKNTDYGYAYGNESAEIEFNSISGSIILKPLENEKAEQEKTEQRTEQKKYEQKEASTSPTASTSQVQAATAKTVKSSD